MGSYRFNWGYFVVRAVTAFLTAFLVQFFVAFWRSFFRAYMAARSRPPGKAPLRRTGGFGAGRARGLRP
jgi:hypothetical protein